MWTILIAVTAALGLLGGWAVCNWLECLEVPVLSLFARLWHHCSSNTACPLPASGAVLVVANHPSPADPAFLIATCGRPLGFFHAREYFDVFALRRLFRRVGCIPVARDGHDVRAVRLALRRLEQGAALAIFPEGDLSSVVAARGDQPRGGAALVALRSRAPVVPAYIAEAPAGPGVLRAWLWPSRGVQVLYGPPVDLTPYYGRPINRPLLREVTALLMAQIDRLRPASASAVRRSNDTIAEVSRQLISDFVGCQSGP